MGFVYGLVNRDDAIITVAEVIQGYSKQSFYRALFTGVR